MDNKQLRELIIKPALVSIDMYSLDAENLIAGTIAQESQMGHYIQQMGGGPALGICQMEPATYQDIWTNYIRYRRTLEDKIYLDYPSPTASIMIHDLKFAVIMCRLHYRRVAAPLPTTLEGYAKYWKVHYNTIQGKGATQEFIDNYLRYATEV